MEKRINKHVYTWVGTFLFGWLGVDRFMRGQILFGILKFLAYVIGSMLLSRLLGVVYLVGTVLGSVWIWIDWIIALTKLGKYEKEFVFVDKKWGDPKEIKEAEERTEALLKADIEETNKRLKEAAERGEAPESVVGYLVIEKIEVLKNSKLYPMVKEFCMELLKQEYQISGVSTEHKKNYDNASISVKSRNDEYLGHIDFYEGVDREAKYSWNLNASMAHSIRDWKHLIWHFPFIKINSYTPYTETPPEWLMICANVMRKNVQIIDPPFVQEYPEARKYVNVIFR